MWLLRTNFLCSNTTFIENLWQNWIFNHMLSLPVSECLLTANIWEVKSETKFAKHGINLLWSFLDEKLWDLLFKPQFSWLCYSQDNYNKIPPDFKLPEFCSSIVCSMLSLYSCNFLPSDGRIHWWCDNSLIAHPLYFVPGETNTQCLNEV